MKRRAAAWLLCLCLVAGAGPSVRAGHDPAGEEEYTAVSTPADLLAIAQAPDGRYRLTANIDMTGVEWIPIPFSGTLDGAGYTIANLSVRQTGSDTEETVDGNDKRYSTEFAGLFSTVTGAVIRDLHLLGADIQVETDAHCFLGGLAGYIQDAEITGCSVDGCLSLYGANVMSGVGGIAGFGSGTIRDSSARVTLVFRDQSQGLRCEQFMGGLLACGNGVLEGSSVDIDGYVSCRGYVHNGGLVGMFYQYDKQEPVGRITGCSVDGVITFYEDNPDRRAYCAAFGGELLTYPAAMEGNTESFTRNETFDYTVTLLPESCAQPEYTETVVLPSCAQWGYTAHTCAGCGYVWKDAYTPPAHEPGDWQIVQPATLEESGLRARVCLLCGATVEEEILPPHVAGQWEVAVQPTYEAPGLRQLLCVDCGWVLEEEEIPALVPVSACRLSQEALSLRYKESAGLTVQVEPEDAADPSVVWSSSDPSVATVDASGTVLAVGRGQAVITCSSADGFASSSCAVSVGYSLGQWLIVILLFGWLWY